MLEGIAGKDLDSNLLASNPRALSALLYCAFALTGLLTSLPGPWLPILAKKWTLTDSQAGSVIAAQFLGNAIGCAFAVRKLRSSIFLGLALIALGTSSLAYLPWPALQIGVFCYGIGLGFTIPATNLLVAGSLPTRSAISLSLLNGVWGVGAISCPALFLLAQRFGAMNRMLLALGASAATLLVLLAACHWPALEPVSGGQPHLTSTSLALALKHLSIFAVLFFLYVGTETCIGGWISLYARRSFAGMGESTPALVTYFWAALILGRAGSAYALRWMGERSLYGASVVLGLGALVLILAGRSLAVIMLDTTLTGLALAPIFPLLLSFAAEPLRSHKNGGWVFVCAALGGAVLPWVTGKISAAYSTLHAGLIVPLAALFLLAILSFWLPRGIENKSERKSTPATSMP